MNPATPGYRRANLALRARTLRDLVQVWALLDPKRLDATFPRWLAAVSLVVNRDRDRAATLAGLYLDQVRQLAGVDSQLLVPPRPLDPERFKLSMRLTSVVAAKKAVGAGQPVGLAMDHALSQHTGAASRLVLNAGRETVAATVLAEGGGWRRVASSTACDFCRMLADRGPVYSKATVAFRAHNHCTCSAEPVYGPTVTTPAPYVMPEWERQLLATVDDDDERAELEPEPAKPDAWLDRFTRKGDYQRLIPAHLRGKRPDWTAEPGSAAAERMADSLNANPQYAYGAEEYRINCTHCVTTWELRQRGYDVVAQPRLGGKGRTDQDWLSNRWTNADGTPAQNNPVRIIVPNTPEQLRATGRVGRRRSSYDQAVREDLLAEPSGSRGVVTVQWKAGGAHVFNYVRDDSEPGGLRFYDPQPGTGNTSASEYLSRGQAWWWVRMDDKVPLEAAGELVRDVNQMGP